MIKFITGAPGNGKSLKALDEMRREYERNAAAVKAGKEQPRRFFTNMAGATVDENPEAFPWVEAIPEHNDWTKLPDGSYVLYDEAHSDGKTPGLERYGHLFPSTGKPGESDDPRIRAMSTHRHRGIDIVLVTQWPSKVHHQVRTLAGEHVHMNRAMGLQTAGVVKWTRVQPDPYDERQREKAEEEIWHFPKDLYGRYRSATLHTATHKFRLSNTLKGGLAKLAVSVLVMWGIYAYYMRNLHKDDHAAAPGGAGAAAPGAALLIPEGVDAVDEKGQPLPAPGQTPVEVAAAAPEPRACIESAKRCRCWDTTGMRMEIEAAVCKAYVVDGFPRIAVGEMNQSTAPAAPATALPTAAPVAAASSAASTTTIPSTTGVGNGLVTESKLSPIGGL